MSVKCGYVYTSEKGSFPSTQALKGAFMLV